MEKRWSVLLTIVLLILIMYSLPVFSEQNQIYRSTKIWTSEEAGEHIFFISNVDIAVTEIRFQTSNPLNSAKMIIEAKNDSFLKSETKENTYQFITIGKFGISDTDLNYPMITFKVDKNWVTNNSDYLTVKLYHNDGAWKELETKYLFDDETHYYYEARPQKLSYFAIIGGEKKEINPKPALKNETIDKITPLSTVINLSNAINDKIVNQSKGLMELFFSKERNNYVFIAALMGVIVIIIILALFVDVVIKGDYYENTEEIRKIIDEELSEGIPKKEIEKDLEEHGWPKKIVEKIVHNERLSHDIEIKIKAYVQTMKNRMHTDDDIKRSLIKEGWAEETVDELINEFTS